MARTASKTTRAKKPAFHPAYFWGGLALVLLAFLGLVGDILLPFIIGILVAYLLDPVVRIVESVFRSRSMATLLVLAVFIEIVVVLMIYLLPYFYSQLQALITEIPDYINHIAERYRPSIQALEERLAELKSEEGDKQQTLNIVQNLSSNIVAWMGKIFKGLLVSGASIVNAISLIFISPIVSFFMLRDWDKMVHAIQSIFPKKHKKTLNKLFTDMDLMISGYLRGMFTVALMLSVFYAIGLSAVGLNYGALIGILTGIFSFIPYVGIFVGIVISMIVATFQFGGDVQSIGMVLGVLLIGQFLEGNFITPNILGERISLHPVWVIFALLAGGALFGFTGVLIAVPVAAVLGVLTRFGIKQYKESAWAA